MFFCPGHETHIKHDGFLYILKTEHIFRTRVAIQQPCHQHLHTCSKNTSISTLRKYIGKRSSNRISSSTQSAYFSNTCANKSADRLASLETITFLRRIRYFLRHDTACRAFCKLAYFSNTCAKYKYQLIPHTRNHHFHSRNTLYLKHLYKNGVFLEHVCKVQVPPDSTHS